MKTISEPLDIPLGFMNKFSYLENFSLNFCAFDKDFSWNPTLGFVSYLLN